MVQNLFYTSSLNTIIKNPSASHVNVPLLKITKAVDISSFDRSATGKRTEIRIADDPNRGKLILITRYLQGQDETHLLLDSRNEKTPAAIAAIATSMQMSPLRLDEIITELLS